MKLRQYSSYVGHRNVMVSRLGVEILTDAGWSPDMGCVLAYRNGRAVTDRDCLPRWQMVAERAIVPNGEVAP